MKKTWLKQAAILGLSFFITILLVQPIGVSTQFSVLSGIIHSTVDKDIITEDDSRESGYASSNAYYDKDNGKLAEEIKHPIHYEFVFVLAIPLGAAVAHLLLRRKRKPQDHIICDIEKKSFFASYGRSFISGFLLLFGARMAGGCTSGHMMSGIMQGSVSGYLFAGVVFAVAIPIAMVTKKRV